MLLEIILTMIYWVVINFILPLGSLYVFIWLMIKVFWGDSDKAVGGKSA